MGLLMGCCSCGGGSTFDPGPGNVSCGKVLCSALPTKWKIDFTGFSAPCGCFNVGVVEFTLKHYVCTCVDLANFIWEADVVPCSGVVLDNIWSILWSGSTNPLATTNTVKLWTSRFDWSGCASDNHYSASVTVGDCLGPIVLNRNSILVACGVGTFPATLTMELA